MWGTIVAETLELSLPAKPTAPAAAREALSRALEAVSPSWRIDDAALLASEVVTNSVRHAQLPPDADILLRASITPESLRVEVLDEGPGFSSTVDLRPRSSEIGTSGWGLFLVDELADAWGVERGPTGSTCVWFELKLTET
ncbi:MAG: ATP-binding protein [Actinomycetota bacterium]|nr:ATP-binding protein [Actinomycetota bacterium]